VSTSGGPTTSPSSGKLNAEERAISTGKDEPGEYGGL